MLTYQKLPIGVENFEEIIHEDYYYVDKTKLIEQILNKLNKVNLFTRPRRFGKSLNMNMLQYFFEIGRDGSLFDGLYISQNKELCDAYMGKYPVISISLKGVNARSYEDACELLSVIIIEETSRLQFLMESDKLSQADKLQLERILLADRLTVGMLTSSLRKLCYLLEKHFDKKVILLIDEYDVPLAKANENGYYDEMVLLIRNFFENVLKTNPHLKFAVLTGCLRVAKESIFTGLNNFKVYSITDVEFDEYFGFTDLEVKEMLHAYGQDDQYEIVKDWYDGYQFGNVDVYCPWDVINYCDVHLSDPDAKPRNFWVNTSGNDVIQHFIEGMNEESQMTKMELERLIDGDSVQKKIHQDLTYKDLYSSSEHLWSALLMTGYLTKRGEANGDYYDLIIPNHEIRNIMIEHVLTLFGREVKKDGAMLDAFCDALLHERPDDVEHIFTEYMSRTISVRDTFVRKTMKENFYHGLLLGILAYKNDWMVRSNRESGDGFSDILIQTADGEVGIVLEVKYAQEGQEEKECERAVKQIIDKRYTDILEQYHVPKILKYGIACNVKRCRVMLDTGK